MKRILVVLFTVPLIAGAGPKSAPRPHSVLMKSVDAVVQERFQKVTEQDIRKGNLGVSRVAVFNRHRWHFDPKNEVERLAVSSLRAEGWSSSFFVVGKRKDHVIGPIAFHPKDPPVKVDRKAVAAIGVPAREYNAPFSGAAGPIALEARPVVASQKKCLACHRGVKLGEPVATVVYAFRRASE